jgi:alkylation response protein AidB-like acyl-CoA dehydrogenase
MMPKSVGGLELDPGEVHQATRLLATACPSTAWAMQLLMTHAHAVPYFDPALQDEIWESDPDVLICSSIAPVGRGEPAEGGVRLTGRYPWSSGSEHAHWAMLGFLLHDGDAPPEFRFAVIPRSDYRIEDVWFAAGLKGTGSQDLVVEDTFVPSHRTEAVMALNFGQSRGYGHESAALYKLPVQPVFAAGFSAVALGAAEALRDLCAARVKTRVRAYTGAKTAESAPALVRIAEATHELRAAALILENNWASMMERARSGEFASMEEFFDWRSDQAYVTRLCVRAADRLFAGAGGSAVLEKSPMQRFWRDIHAGAAHAYNDYDIAAQVLGRQVVGLPPDQNLF